MTTQYATGTINPPNVMTGLATAVRTLLTNVGWTLFDTISSAAGSGNRVMKAPAASRLPFFLQFEEFFDSNYRRLRVRGAGDWDAVTHSGGILTSVYASGNSYGGVRTGDDSVAEVSITYDAVASEEGVAIAVRYGGKGSVFCGGLLRPVVLGYRGGVASLASNIAAGATSFPTTASMVGKLQVGQDLILVSLTGDSADARFNKTERVTVSSVSASAIGISATANAYKAGSLAGTDPLPLAVTFSQVDSAGGTDGDLFGADTQQVFFPYWLDGSLTMAGPGPTAFINAGIAGVNSGFRLDQQLFGAGAVPLWGVFQNLLAYSADWQGGGPTNFKGPRGQFPPLFAHTQNKGEAVGDRIQTDTDEFYRVIRHPNNNSDHTTLIGPGTGTDITGGTTRAGYVYARPSVTLDTTPPTVTNFSPAAGTAILATAPIGFDVTDNGTLRRVIVMAEFPNLGIREVVHDGDSFGPSYNDGSNTRTAISGGYHYSVLRRGGWPGSPTIRVRPFDTGGNEA